MAKETRTATTVSEGIGNMIETMTRSFARFAAPCFGGLSGEGLGTYVDDEYGTFFEVNTGRKYAKVLNRDSVKAFVVLTDTDKKFRRGDILKPASYSSPTRNSARGNVLEGDYEIYWTGPQYL